MFDFAWAEAAHRAGLRWYPKLLVAAPLTPVTGPRLLGRDRLTALTLYDLGPYPGAKAVPSPGAVVEVYAINAEQLALLDQLEGYAAAAPSEGLYNRAILPTRHGDAWCYVYNPEVNESTKIEQGEW